MIILNSDRPKFCIHSLFLSRWYGVVKINWLNFRLKLTTVCNDHSLRIVFKNRKFQIYIVNNVSPFYSLFYFPSRHCESYSNGFIQRPFWKSNSRLYEPYVCCVVVLKPHCFPQLETKRIGFETKHRQIRYFNLRKTRGVTKCKIQVFSVREKWKEIEFLHWQRRVIRGSKLIFLDCFTF